jgi:hypothetical protein
VGVFLEAAGLVRREILHVNEGQSTDQRSRGSKIIITAIETFLLRIPLNAGSKSEASAWGDRKLPNCRHHQMRATD